MLQLPVACDGLQTQSRRGREKEKGGRGLNLGCG
jgi:hypothetical protein